MQYHIKDVHVRRTAMMTKHAKLALFSTRIINVNVSIPMLMLSIRLESSFANRLITLEINQQTKTSSVESIILIYNPMMFYAKATAVLAKI